MRKVLGWGLAAALTGGVALAEDVQVEVSILDASQVTLHLYPFLKAEELATLRLVATNRDVLIAIAGVFFLLARRRLVQ